MFDFIEIDTNGKLNQLSYHASNELINTGEQEKEFISNIIESIQVFDFDEVIQNNNKGYFFRQKL